jgi:Protein of unknown function (DUF4089)
MKKTRKTKRKKIVSAATKSTRRPRAKKGNGSPGRQTDAVDSLITASAQVLELPIDQTWRQGVKFNLQLICRLGALVDEFPLPDATEPGPVFHA